MTQLQKRIVSVLATGALLANLLAAPAFAASTTITITGNGANTNNDANVNIDSTVYVTQTNVADVKNDINADADTGKNDANYNTGGNVEIKTGNATTDVAVTNNLNQNAAQVNCCPTGDVTVEVKDNLYGSDNTVNLNLNQAKDTGVLVEQTNDANIRNYVDADADTGKNDADYNGGGTVKIQTGSAMTKVAVANAANANMAVVGGGSGDGETDLALRILRNGANSDNDINLNLDRSIWVDQLNVADIKNDIDADADTGKNDANYNGGGLVEIKTGNATTDVEVANELNFNFADLDCGCLLDVEAKVADNGADSYNTITANLLDVQGAVQENYCGDDPESEWSWWWWGPKCDTLVDADADTGKNDADYNGGGGDGDPSITTGNASTEVDAGTSGNVNVVGDAPDLEWPVMPEMPEFEFNFNLGWLWLFMGGNA